MNISPINVSENETLPELTDVMLIVPYTTSTPDYEWDMSSIIKDAIIGGVGFIPGAGSAMSFLLGLFWPQQKDNTWEQILQKVEQMIENAVLQTIKGILNGDIQEIKGKMEHVQYMLETSPGSQESHDAYMFLARYLVSIDEKFKSFDNKTNYQILPMYTNTVMLQIPYWKMGIEKKNDIGLTDIEVNELKQLIDKLVDKAKSYIHTMYTNEYNDAINTSTASSVTNNLLSVRGYCLLHGLECIELIEHLQNNSLESGFYPKTISYSTVFDRQTNKMRIQALTEDDQMQEPFKPSLINGKYNKIQSLLGYVQRIGNAPRVGGIKITFANGSSYTLGTVTSETSSIELNDSVIERLEVWGNGAVDEALFTLSDGRQLRVGERYATKYRKYAVDGHYIAGLYLASDEPSLAGQAAGIAVSYHMLDDKK
ncbi:MULTISPECIES: insecticidal delta-endotoxin Cry8Ea1 family protein [Xenorhabdus]|uniref:CryIII delta-endotoxin n=1 Tax=Xenorhabdus ehlersii TaxID=290111 RepID=A0A2D0IVW0_9GAMM|nr:MULTISPECIES: insecticidal delta-endotoxin Cry8Ea1 family protein [Xenorhabdus]MBC8949662.1 CryIII delta-endotoxin [Xenorhabdus sp. TS4]PHM26048.1 CryIII delta-endotoxin [Xenorhabdus ehlersii]RKE88604.1 delta endotoxin-like protein [Xenorhabdus ehlersii]